MEYQFTDNMEIVESDVNSVHNESTESTVIIVNSSGSSQGNAFVTGTRRQRKNKSEIWKWFSKSNREEGVCNICKKTFKTKAGSTTSLRRHMESQHSEVYKSLAQETPENSAIVKNVSESHKKFGKLDKTSPRAEDLTNAVAHMIVLDCQPFSIVNDTGFRNHLNIAEPRYQIPGRTVLSETIIPELYRNERKRIEEQIVKDIRTVSITFPMFVTFISMFCAILKNLFNFM